MEYINWVNLIEKETKKKLKILISESDEKIKILFEEFFKNAGLEINLLMILKKQ